MKKFLNLVAGMLLVVSISGCEGFNYGPYGPNQIGGAVMGGSLGGLAGNQIGRGSGRDAMTALGAVGGLLLGSGIGRQMDDQQRQQRVYVQPQPNVVYVPVQPFYYGGGGFAQCDALGEMSQARADCVHALSKHRVQQEGQRILLEQQQNRWWLGY